MRNLKSMPGSSMERMWNRGLVSKLSEELKRQAGRSEENQKLAPAGSRNHPRAEKMKGKWYCQSPGSELGREGELRQDSTLKTERVEKRPCFLCLLPSNLSPVGPLCQVFLEDSWKKPGTYHFWHHPAIWAEAGEGQGLDLKASKQMTGVVTTLAIQHSFSPFCPGWTLMQQHIHSSIQTKTLLTSFHKRSYKSPYPGDVTSSFTLVSWHSVT